MSLPNPNPFDLAKADFKTETGLDWKTNIDAYIAYLSYRVQRDISFQIGTANGHLNVLSIEIPKMREGIYKIEDILKRK